MEANLKKTLLMSATVFALFSWMGLTGGPTSASPVHVADNVVVDAPKLTPGDTWTWTGSIGRTETFVGKEGDLLAFRMGPKKTKYRTAELNFVKDVDSDGKVLNFRDPHAGLLSFPLYVGKKWERKYSSSLTKASDRYASFEVKEYREVSTEAGKFMAFVIVVNDIGQKEFTHFSGTYYYAPDVKNIVHYAARAVRDNKPFGEYDLKSYKLKN
ncbi:MAG: hypothetical protein C3F14_00530 [Deltaproteobacteria bacterium]|nr:MAG: hypothetical protein C3F14_00530 [Deltaproteobacteria bacterium]